MFNGSRALWSQSVPGRKAKVIGNNTEFAAVGWFVEWRSPDFLMKVYRLTDGSLLFSSEFNFNIDLLVRKVQFSGRFMGFFHKEKMYYSDAVLIVVDLERKQILLQQGENAQRGGTNCFAIVNERLYIFNVDGISLYEYWI